MKSTPSLLISGIPSACGSRGLTLASRAPSAEQSYPSRRNSALILTFYDFPPVNKYSRNILIINIKISLCYSISNYEMENVVEYNRQATETA